MTLMKVRLKGAQKGHSLLKKKSDALTIRFRQILQKIIEVRYTLDVSPGDMRSIWSKVGRSWNNQRVRFKPLTNIFQEIINNFLRFLLSGSVYKFHSLYWTLFLDPAELLGDA